MSESVIRRLAALATLPALLLLTITPAFADLLVPVSQDRRIDATAFAEDLNQSGDDADEAIATDFGPFVDSATASFDVEGGSGSGGGSQSSTIGASQITASATMFAVGEVWEQDVSAGGFGHNRFEVTFDVAETTDYTLTGTIGAFDNGNGRVTLTGPSGDIHDFPSFNELELFDVSGTLTPGQYTLRGTLSGSAFGDFFLSDYASGEFDIDFQASTVVAVGDAASTPGPLLRVYPNPFRSSATIDAGQGAATAVTVLDVTGRVVARFAAPRGPVVWDGRDVRGITVPPGAYFVRLETPEGTGHRRVVRLR